MGKLILKINFQLHSYLATTTTMTDLVTSALLARSGLWGSTVLAPTVPLRSSVVLNNALTTSALYPGYAGWGGYYGGYGRLGYGGYYGGYGLGYAGLGYGYGGLGYAGLGYGYGGLYGGLGYGYGGLYGLGYGYGGLYGNALARSVALRNSLYPGLYKSTVVADTTENTD